MTRSTDDVPNETVESSEGGVDTMQVDRSPIAPWLTARFPLLKQAQYASVGFYSINALEADSAVHIHMASISILDPEEQLVWQSDFTIHDYVFITESFVSKLREFRNICRSMGDESSLDQNIQSRIRSIIGD